MKKLLTLTLIIFIALPAFTQVSQLLDRNKSGLGILGGVAQGYGFNGFHGRAVATLKGKVDFEVLAIYDKYDKAKKGLLTDNATSLETGAYITWWFLQTSPTQSMNVNIGLKPGFEYAKHNNYKYIHSIDGNTVEYKYWAEGVLGLDINMVYKLTDAWLLQPDFYIAYQVSSEKLTELGKDETNSYTGVQSVISATLAKKFEKGNALFLKVNQLCDTYGTGTFYHFEVGYVMPF